MIVQTNVNHKGVKQTCFCSLSKRHRFVLGFLSYLVLGDSWVYLSAQKDLAVFTGSVSYRHKFCCYIFPLCLSCLHTLHLSHTFEKFCAIFTDYAIRTNSVSVLPVNISTFVLFIYPSKKFCHINRFCGTRSIRFTYFRRYYVLVFLILKKSCCTYRLRLRPSSASSTMTRSPRPKKS